jgi:transcription termination factor Rho
MIFYVLQENIQEDDQPLYDDGTAAVPKTVLIPSPDKLRKRTRLNILHKSRDFSVFHIMDPKHLPTEVYTWASITPVGLVDFKKIHYSPSKEQVWGMELPPEIVTNWGIVEGDEVTIMVDSRRNLVIVTSVNGETDPRKTLNWPHFFSLQPDSPKRPLPVEKYGDFDLRVITLLAPLAIGQGYWIIAPGNSGKTWIEKKILAALMRLTEEDESLHIIFAYVGDRPADFPGYKEITDRAHHNRVEVYQSPWTDKPASQVSMTQFVVRRARRLASMGKNVVLLFDSISRTVAVHTGLEEDKKGGMVPGGIYWESIFEMIPQLLGAYGWYNENSSLTIIGTVLSAEDSSNSAEAAVDREATNSTPNATLRLVKNPTLKYPRVSVDRTATAARYPDGRDFRTDAQKREMKLVEEIMWAPLEKDRMLNGKPQFAEAAHDRLIRYCQENPLPQYIHKIEEKT